MLIMYEKPRNQGFILRQFRRRKLVSFVLQEIKEEIRPSHITNALTPTENSKKQSDNTKRH